MKLYLFFFAACLSLCACDKGKTMQQIAQESQRNQFDSIYSILKKEYFIEPDSFTRGIPKIIYPKNKPNSLQEEYTTRTISSEEINNIIKTYQYFKELGGELDSPDISINQDN